MNSKDETKGNAPKPGGLVEEPAITGDAGRVSSSQGRTDRSLGASVGATANDSFYSQVLICDFEHLYQLKTYLTDKRNTKVVRF